VLFVQKYEQMTPKEFHQTFPDEATCRSLWKSKRESMGIECRKCKSKDHYWHSGKQIWRCKKCASQTSLRSGTVMEHSNLPLLTWFTAMFEMIHRRKSLSGKEMYQKLDVKSEGTAWYLMHKIRIAMGHRDGKYELDGTVEMDDAFITVVKEINAGVTEEEKSKRGRGSIRKAPILVMASYSNIPRPKQKKGRPKTYPKFFKMIFSEDLKRESINNVAFKYIKLRSRVKTDGYRGYNDLKELMKDHIQKVTPQKVAHLELPWVHTAIGNFKRYVDGIHHHISDTYLQNYLDEFVYKTNRRFIKNPFENIVTAALQKVWG
jgi:hypothetical protein